MKTLIVLLLAFIGYCGEILSQNFEISPASLNFNAEPGESQSKFIYVKNHSSSPETFILSVSDFRINNKGENEYLEAGSIKQSIADWLSFAPVFFEVLPNEEKQITVTLQMPVDQSGSKWGTIFIKTAQEQTAYTADKSIQAGLSVTARMAVNVSQTPGTNKSYQATISNLMQLDNVNENDSLRVFSALVNNLSEIITPCKTFLIATNLETAEETIFDEIEFYMYPKSSRKIELELKGKLIPGAYSLAAVLDYGSNTNLEGTQILINID